MEFVPKEISDKELLAFTRGWLSKMAEGDYQNIIDCLGYGMSSDPHPDDIQCRLSSYRSPLYPDVTEFTITEWSQASGGNPSPKDEIVWYRSNEAFLVAAISHDLPLNNKWSDLQIDFVLFDGHNEGYLFRIEEICPQPIEIA